MLNRIEDVQEAPQSSNFNKNLKCLPEYNQSTDSTGGSIVSECRLGKWSRTWT